MDRLPNELKCRIAVYCDRAVLKTMRLLSRHYCNAATPLLFQDIMITAPALLRRQHAATTLTSLIPYITSLWYYMLLEYDPLSGHHQHSHPELADFASTFLKGTTWPRLSRLKLFGIVASEDEIYNFFQAHSRTLQYLELGHLEITSRRSSEHRPCPDSGSVVSLLQRIRDACRLEEVHVNGIFSNRASEEWQASESDYLQSPDCFKLQIERWMTHKGHFPFVDWPREQHDSYCNPAMDILGRTSDGSWIYWGGWHLRQTEGALRDKFGNDAADDKVDEEKQAGGEVIMRFGC